MEGVCRGRELPTHRRGERPHRPRDQAGDGPHQRGGRRGGSEDRIDGPRGHGGHARHLLRHRHSRGPGARPTFDERVARGPRPGRDGLPRRHVARRGDGGLVRAEPGRPLRAQLDGLLGDPGTGCRRALARPRRQRPDHRPSSGDAPPGHDPPERAAARARATQRRGVRADVRRRRRAGDGRPGDPHAPHVHPAAGGPLPGRLRRAEDGSDRRSRDGLRRQALAAIRDATRGHGQLERRSGIHRSRPRHLGELGRRGREGGAHHRVRGWAHRRELGRPGIARPRPGAARRRHPRPDRRGRARLAGALQRAVVGGPVDARPLDERSVCGLRARPVHAILGRNRAARRQRALRRGGHLHLQPGLPERGRGERRPGGGRGDAEGGRARAAVAGEPPSLSGRLRPRYRSAHAAATRAPRSARSSPRRRPRRPWDPRAPTPMPRGARRACARPRPRPRRGCACAPARARRRCARRFPRSPHQGRPCGSGRVGPADLTTRRRCARARPSPTTRRRARAPRVGRPAPRRPTDRRPPTPPPRAS